MSASLRILKEIACRPIEAYRLKWIDIDIANRCATITTMPLFVETGLLKYKYDQ